MSRERELFHQLKQGVINYDEESVASTAQAVVDEGVPVEQFVAELLKTNADIVCLSAMMTTTMVGMKEVILRIKEKNPNVKILIGGAPVTEEIAQNFNNSLILSRGFNFNLEY